MTMYVVAWERSMAVEAQTEEEAIEAVEHHLMGLGVEAHNVQVIQTTKNPADASASELMLE